MKIVTGVIATAVATTAAVVVAQPAYAATAIYAAPAGSGTACSASAPCSIGQAQAQVRSAPAGDVTVQLAAGTYRISSPLQFRAEDGGRGGTVLWTAAPGANPLITGALDVSGWSLHDAASNIYVANVPVGLETRQLYVNGVNASRAAIKLNNSDITLTATGMRVNNSALNYLSTLPQQNRIEFESIAAFTNRYAQVASISGNVITMAQPGWNNNTWGYDTVQSSLIGGPTYFLGNSLRFLTTVGQWYIDPAAGRLYYKPAPGVHPDQLDIELPRLQSLLSIGGTYSNPVSNLAFRGIKFSGTSWLGPSSVEGYANQQNGTFLKGTYSYRPSDAFTSCARGCTMFERARNTWLQEPAAVQVSAANHIAFTDNTFANLGQSALGIGQDANAMVSGVGLGASDIDVIGNKFTEVSGHGIAVGGIQPDAHHPSDQRMVNKNVRIEDNTVNRVAVDYKDNSGILSTYVTNARIVRNEVANVAYDAIDTGYGWGSHDPGGSNEYANRGYYNYSTRYTTPTTLRDNYVANNLVHNTKARFHDGGSVYNLSASPGTVLEENYLYNVSGVGLYLDEGTRYTNYRNNVLQGSSPWVFTNSYGTAHNTSDNMITGNWYNSGGAQIPDAAMHNNQVTGNIQVSGTAWPTGAQAVICEAGVAAQRRTELNANLFAPNGTCGQTGSPVAAPYLTTATSAASSFFAQSGSRFALSAAGADVWSGAGDEFGAIYQDNSVTSGTSVSAKVDSLNDSHAYAKTGVMIRNDMTRPGSSNGYALVAVTRTNGVLFEWDSNGDGYVDSESKASVDTYRPVWVKLTRSGNQATAYYSYDGANFIQIGSSVTLTGASATQDGGTFTTSHDRTQRAINVVSDLRISGSQNVPTVQIVGGPSGRCVDAPGTSTTNGTQVRLWDCNGGGNQRWTYTSGKQLMVYGNKCLDASGGGTSNGVKAIIWDCNGQANQQWNLNSNGTITGVQSGLCLDASASGTVNGTLIHLWTCHGGSNQQWSQRS
ncbi:ricin-type beta-trefoil lectin domain protein [Micromonospora sp. NPDC053740]|uniref:ricin-type beta-trefoil lectin domain protein n=1 Tax=Micromonospora TaxID=1873 RepID=UPI001EE8A335|nr:ricin-type beta-trefoil lectin domain protein [Micromonospora alfalfae]MCG5461976.1 ricin-type beta-trefoil lectin domain protein [Micromonospora alfalfae]